MKRVMSITAVLAAVTCHSAYGQLDNVGGAAQNAAGQIGSTADSAADSVQSQAGQTQAGASANAQADTDLNTDSGANLSTDANAQAAASTQNQLDRGTRNLNRGLGGIAGIVPPIPQQASTGNNGPYDARWRFTQRNGQWWYYSPQNQWMVRQNDEWQNYDDSYQPLADGNVDQGTYSSGYRGNRSDQGEYSGQQQLQGNQGNAGQGQMRSGQMHMAAHTGPAYLLRYDNTGREYICVQGQRVYFDDQANRNRDNRSMSQENGNQNNGQPALPNDQSGDQRYQSERQNLDATDPANSPASADEPEPSEPNDDNASEAAEKSADDDSENQPEPADAENNDDTSDDA